MANPISYPLVVFVASLILLWIVARIGAAYRKKRPRMNEDVHDDLIVVLGATLTLLGLIIGITFSMAVTRYVVLPSALAISPFLRSGIESPRGGIIHVRPDNLRALADSLRSQ